MLLMLSNSPGCPFTFPKITLIMGGRGVEKSGRTNGAVPSRDSSLPAPGLSIIIAVMSFLHLWKRLTSRKILVYADFIDPFCYIGFHSLQVVADARGIDLDWRGFELNPATPPEGLVLQTAGNSDLRPGMWASVRDLARRAGLDFPEPERVPNTSKTHELVELAKKFDVKNPLIARIYQAYFNEQNDIGQVDVLIRIGAEFKLPEEMIKTALADRRYEKRITAHRREAETRAFAGMPGFVYAGENYFGALSQDAWQKRLAEK